jgi:hypothetical protein
MDQTTALEGWSQDLSAQALRALAVATATDRRWRGPCRFLLDHHCRQMKRLFGVANQEVL